MRSPVLVVLGLWLLAGAAGSAGVAFAQVPSAAAYVDKPISAVSIEIEGRESVDPALMEAIQTGGQPLTSAQDNLGTLRVVEAAYRSMSEARSVSPLEIAA